LRYFFACGTFAYLRLRGRSVFITRRKRAGVGGTNQTDKNFARRPKRFYSAISQDEQFVHGIQHSGSLRNDDNGDSPLFGAQKRFGERLFAGRI
jgi:hypothetical protein